MSVVDNYLRVQEDIYETALKTGRDPSDIKLVAVTKGVSWETAADLYRLGQRDFGENRLQEVFEKIEKASTDCCWHMIGSLQSNKVRKVIGKFCLIHSVDTMSLAKRLSMCSQEAGVVTSILLQVNTSEEVSKHGLIPLDWKRCFEEVMTLPNLKVQGLMTMAPNTKQKSIIHQCFGALRELRDELKAKAGGRILLSELSMGMSQDYQEAIAEGATLLRIGSALFNP